jgi:hypothetical protein
MQDVRRKVDGVLISEGVNGNQVDDVASVLGEFVQNAWRHGVEHEVLGVDVVVTPGTEEVSESVDIAVANRVPRSAIREDGTLEGMDFRDANGEVTLPVDDDELLYAQHGYGLRTMVHEFTGGRWGYEIKKDEEGSDEVEVVTHAVVGGLGRAAIVKDGLDAAA